MIGAGGTGGHVYPALAVTEALLAPDPVPEPAQTPPEVVFVGTQGSGGYEKTLVERSGLAFTAYEAVLAGPLNRVHPLRLLSSLAKLSFGVVQAFGVLLRHRPGAILLTGGWANAPLALAAWVMRVPVLVYLPDIEPARMINLLKRFARQVAITVPESARYFREGQTVVTGYPLRQKLLQATREDALQHFELDPARPILLVMGGSRGAQTLNAALLDILPDLLADGVQVLHLTGRDNLDAVCAQAGELAEHADYRPLAYLDEAMGLAFAAADLVVSRAGASILGELPYFGLPAILVPYPFAWRYQRVNADYLVERGAALRVDDDAMRAELLPTIREVLRDDARRATMREAARTLAHPQASARIAALLLALAGGD